MKCNLSSESPSTVFRSLVSFNIPEENDDLTSRGLHLKQAMQCRNLVPTQHLLQDLDGISRSQELPNVKLISSCI
jgi:hypothetical protein